MDWSYEASQAKGQARQVQQCDHSLFAKGTIPTEYIYIYIFIYIYSYIYIYISRERERERA